MLQSLPGYRVVVIGADRRRVRIWQDECVRNATAVVDYAEIVKGQDVRTSGRQGNQLGYLNARMNHPRNYAAYA